MESTREAIQTMKMTDAPRDNSSTYKCEQRCSSRLANFVLSDPFSGDGAQTHKNSQGLRNSPRLFRFSTNLNIDSENIAIRRPNFQLNFNKFKCPGVHGTNRDNSSLRNKLSRDSGAKR